MIAFKIITYLAMIIVAIGLAVIAVNFIYQIVTIPIR